MDGHGFSYRLMSMQANAYMGRYKNAVVVQT